MDRFPKTVKRVNKLDAKDTGRTTSQGHKIYFCPFCYDKEVKYGVKDPKPDTTGKLYILESKNHGFCQRCLTAVFTNWTIENSFQKLADLVLDHYTPLDLRLENLPNIDLDSYGSAADEDWATEYLFGRNPALTPAMIRKLGLKAFSTYIGTKDEKGEFKRILRQGVLTPLVYKGETKSYQIRYLTKEKKFRFHTMDGIKLLYSITEIPQLSEITIVEGVFDLIGALGLGFPNIVALLGKTPSPYQLEQLKELCPTRINLFLDNPGLNSGLAKTLRKQIRSITKQKVWCFKWGQGDWLDPEEYFVRSKFKKAYKEWS